MPIRNAQTHRFGLSRSLAGGFVLGAVLAVAGVAMAVHGLTATWWWPALGVALVVIGGVQLAAAATANRHPRSQASPYAR